MPKDTEETEYRIQNIKINDISYTPQLSQIEEYYQKYVLYNFSESLEGKYEITEISYTNQFDLTDSHTHYQKQVCYMTIKDDIYSFRIEYENRVAIEGKLFECIYQFNKENGTFMNLWYKATGNYEKLDEDKRSFFYFAFNCYDKEREIKFTPEDILQVDVEYDELHYSYTGKEKDKVADIEPKITADINESITPSNETVTAKESKRSNGFYYQYETINRLSEVDFEQNISEDLSGVLQHAANSYDWAISVGNKQGYRYALNNTWFSRDYEYTKIREFKTIHITYIFEGVTYSVDTDSLMGNKVTTLPEVVPESKSDSLGILEKAKRIVIGMVAFLLALHIIKRVIKKQIKKKMR